jgi:hypothetical protein
MSPKDRSGRGLAWVGAGMGVVVAAGRLLRRQGKVEPPLPVVPAPPPPPPPPVERKRTWIPIPEPTLDDPPPVRIVEDVWGTRIEDASLETFVEPEPWVEPEPVEPEPLVEPVETPAGSAPGFETVAEQPPLPTEHQTDSADVWGAPEIAPETADDLWAAEYELAVPEEPPAPRLPQTRTRRPVLEVAGLAVVAGLVAGMIGGYTWLALAVALVVLGSVGLWVLAFHPLVVFGAMAFMLGFAPGVQTPILNISITFVLSAAVWIAMAFMPDARHRASWPAVLSALLITVSLFSVVGNPISATTVADFVRWAITTAAVYPFLVLPPAKLARVGRWFVGGCTLAALVGIGFVAVDPDGSRLFTISFFGYAPGQLNSRYVLGDNGPVIRLTGTYVDPNLGGLIMAAGLILALVLLRGRRRILASGVLVIAIALTLSRADAGSVAMAGILLVLFSGISSKVRTRLLGLGVVAFLGLISLPAVRTRLANSFGSRDRGSSARWEAIEAMPDQLRGHWFFGRGFGAPELIDATATAATNYVANAPLLAVYRGGVIVGLTFTVLMLMAGVQAWRMLRRHDFESAALGAGYLGLMLVAFQLDIPIITLTPAVLVFSLLLAFLGNPETVAPDVSHV